MAGPAVWCVADGRAGILNQTRALAAALGERLSASGLEGFGELSVHELILQPRGLQLAIRPDLWPCPLAALPRDQRKLIRPPWPDIWIAAGRRTIPYSRMMRRWSGSRTLVVQTQDPRVSLQRFDLVIPPEHDALAGPNVLPILGPPVWFTHARIEAAKTAFGRLSKEPGQKVLVTLGGDSRTHRFTEDRAAAIAGELRRIAAGRQLWITVSRRTPQAVRDRFRAVAGELGAVFWENEARDGPNPYVAFLAMCDAVLVTEDSANMLADPAFFAKPIHIMKLTGGSERFERLHEGFIARGAARWFRGEVESWSYAPLREAARACEAIIQLLLERQQVLQARSPGTPAPDARASPSRRA